MTSTKSRKIAVIGSGISGLSAAWLLSQRHNVTLFEKNDRLGGHSNTRIVETDDGKIPVDTGFIVYNEKNYPNLTALFDYLDVPTTQSSMTFAFSLNGGSYEYSGGKGLDGWFRQKSNLARQSHWRLIKDIFRFFDEAPARVLSYGETISIGDFLEFEGYSPAFLHDHILPMAGAIWSAPAATMKSYPARSFLDFYGNHGLLKARNRPKWRSVLGGSAEYVSCLVNDADIELRLACPIAAVRRTPDFVALHEPDGTEHRFDDVVLASHADASLAMLADSDALERQLLGQFSYSDNLAILHGDAKAMPRRRKLWSSWNYMADRRSVVAGERASVSYWMNSLQQLETSSDLFVSVNPLAEIDPGLVHYETRYRHPIFDAKAVETQRSLWALQGRNRTWFCGSYFGYGFHEDGLQSGLAVAEQLGGVRRPWNVPEESGRIHASDTGSRFLEAAE